MQAFLVQRDVSVCTKRWSRPSVHSELPNTHSRTDYSESHEASQIEVSNIGTQITQCDSQFNAVRHQSANMKKRKNTTMTKETKTSSTHSILRTCQPPACQRFPGGIERQERKDAVPGQEDGKDRGEGRECNQVHRKEEEKNSAVLHTMWRQKAMVPREVRAH